MNNTEWVLVRYSIHPSKDTWKFRTHDKHNIQVFHNGSVDQANYANGYYPTAEARTMWDQLVSKGYTQ
jgi:hypothetical protein